MSYEEEKQDRKIDQLGAEIERLRANERRMQRGYDRLLSFLRKESLIEEEYDENPIIVGAAIRALQWRAARIQELEDALVEAKAEHNYGPQWKWTGAEKLKDDYRRSARDQLIAEGRIGNSEHFTGVSKMIWQITDERKAALLRAYDIVSWIDRVDSDNKLHITAILGMIKEAEAGQ